MHLSPSCATEDEPSRACARRARVVPSYYSGAGRSPAKKFLVSLPSQTAKFVKANKNFDHSSQSSLTHVPSRLPNSNYPVTRPATPTAGAPPAAPSAPRWATSRAPRVFEAADVTCEQAAKRRHSIWIILDMRCARDLGDGATERARSKAHLRGKERADDARKARAEQHEKRATKTEQVVRRTSPREAPITMRRPAAVRRTSNS